MISGSLNIRMASYSAKYETRATARGEGATRAQKGLNPKPDFLGSVADATGQTNHHHGDVTTVKGTGTM